MLLELFIGFLEVGLFSFGGAYAAIPLISKVVMQHNWISQDSFMYMIGISESTPGPVMVNLATFVGYEKAGILGSIVATFASIFPAFLIILLLITVCKKLLENKYFKVILKGLHPCIIGIILSAGLVMLFKNLFASKDVLDITAVIITGALFLISYIYNKIYKKKISPILLIFLSALIGIVVY